MSDKANQKQKVKKTKELTEELKNLTESMHLQVKKLKNWNCN
jgi:hypothetical protein